MEIKEHFHEEVFFRYICRIRAFTPATAQRFAECTQNRSLTQSFLLVTTELLLPVITLQLSGMKEMIMRLDHAISLSMNTCWICPKMFAAVSMLQMGIARWLVHDLFVKHLISTAKDLSQFLSFLSSMDREKGLYFRCPRPLDVRMEHGDA